MWQLKNNKNENMNAATYHRYGPPSVVSLEEIPKPACLAGEIIIEVYATTVNRTDCGFRSAVYFVSRFWSGLFAPKNKVLGCEFAGIVESVGIGVSYFKPGDKIFGYDDEQFGGHAEYKKVKATGNIAEMPEGIPFPVAAALTEGAHYALNIIRAAKVIEGQQVMVYGATGAIGTAAVQLLKYFGAQVLAVSNSKNIELVKSLGADKVIDYEKTHFKETDWRFDFVFDAVGKTSFGACKGLLKPGGFYISTELGKGGENIFLALWGSIIKSSKRVLFPIPTTTQEDIIFLKSLYEQGVFKPIIDRTYPLENIVDAYRYVETGQKTGNVVITVGKELA